MTARCWDELNITQQLEEWWQVYETNCTQMAMGFASCYQQIAGVEQQQCSDTGPDMCDFPTDLDAYTPLQAYTLYTIFSIWQWFDSIWGAIDSADMTANGPVGQIVKLINPEASHQNVLGDFLQALSALTPLLKVPSEITAVSNTIETILRQTPGVVKQLFPSGTLDSEVVQINNIYNGLSVVKSTYQSNISDALSTIQNNFDYFQAWAANGTFVAPRSSIEAQTVNLTRTLETFIIAQCLEANNIIITLSRETNPLELAHNGSLTTPDLVSCDSYNEYGVCDAWWYDPSTNAAFSLNNLGNEEKNYYDLMNTLFSNGWTTGSDLFLGAKACADYQAVNGGANTPTIDTGSLLPRCISNVQVCVYDQSCGIGDTTCEFTNEYAGCTKVQKDYSDTSCGVSDDVVSEALPASYLGPDDHSTSDTLILCS
ncbi:MAG: hypothetical protein M1827_006166 [Pycnora praestabilis]|nr:MAG: hypothetical protein M1827_006166 [Pycnora praestabilis]